MSVLLEYCIPFVKTGGQFISYKSEKAEDEIKQTTNAQNKLGCKFIKSYSFNLPETDISRRFYIFEKDKKLSKTYPRQAGKPKKIHYKTKMFHVKHFSFIKQKIA